MKHVYYINFFTAFCVFLVGLLMVLKIILPMVESSTRIIFGFIFMAYGVYRYVTTQTKIKINRQEEQRRKMEKAQDDLIHRNKQIF